MCPTNTLYIGSVGSYTKQDIENIFGKHEGFIELRLVSNYCFITFDNVEHARISLLSTYNKIKNIYVTFAKTETRHLITKKMKVYQPIKPAPTQNIWFEKKNKPINYGSYSNVVKYGCKQN